MFHLSLLLFLIKNELFTIKFCAALTCEEVLSKGSGSAFTVEELKTLSSLDTDDIKNCIILLGKEELSREQSFVLWTSLLTIFESAESIPEDSLQQLGYISTGIPPEQFNNLSLTDVDTIAAFGKYTFLSSQQLKSLRDAVLEQWSSKDIEDLSGYDLMTLRQIICSFNISEIMEIHPDAYKDAAQELSTLTNCSKEVFEGLAQLATSSLAFGDPKHWTSLHIATIGCIIAGLPSIRVIPPAATEGLTKSTVACLLPEVLKEMSEEQISNLSPSAAGALNEKQLSVLYPNQKYAVKSAIKGRTEKENSSLSLFQNNPVIVILSLLLYCLVQIS